MRTLFLMSVLATTTHASPVDVPAGIDRIAGLGAPVGFGEGRQNHLACLFVLEPTEFLPQFTPRPLETARAMRRAADVRVGRGACDLKLGGQQFLP